jgi:hypothetical protein
MEERLKEKTDIGIWFIFGLNFSTAVSEWRTASSCSRVACYTILERIGDVVAQFG